MKRHCILLALLSCGIISLKAADTSIKIDITERHLHRIILGRGLGMELLNPEKPSFLTDNVRNTVTNATRALFAALTDNKPRFENVIRLLNHGADSRARISFEHKGTLSSVTPRTIASACAESNALLNVFKVADDRINNLIKQQVLPKENDLRPLLQKILEKNAQPDNSHEEKVEQLENSTLEALNKELQKLSFP